jgi:hypothetical protein
MRRGALALVVDPVGCGRGVVAVDEAVLDDDTATRDRCAAGDAHTASAAVGALHADAANPNGLPDIRAEAVEADDESGRGRVERRTKDLRAVDREGLGYVEGAEATGV